jgi:hypothetical protein
VYLPEQQISREFSRIIAILMYAVNNWTDFDGWALSKGFDPLEIPARRLVAAAWLFLTEPMDYEQKDKLIANLFAETYEEVKQKKKKEEPKGPKTVMAPSKDKWRAPPGWKPPGWSDEAAYQSGINFMANKPE